MNIPSVLFGLGAWFCGARAVKKIKMDDKLTLAIAEKWNTIHYWGDAHYTGATNQPSHKQIRRVLLLAERLQ